ncbi:MAG: NAD(P)/FAD-dependent oxidoreductase [Firmicutes bacterium]|jgi:L-2-hydroxyglutarate oxidase LhgO|nr:NAD(P)/FAD-dependent oxidoreductase [Bacillota bacterium]
MQQTDILIIGAGVVGLAIAAELAARKKEAEVVVLERRERFGLEISSRNSEVIHAGIYYPKNSLKARLCVEGNALLYSFCEQWGVPYRRLGKLIVARSDDEIRSLEELLERGRANGIAGLELLDQRAVAALEPHVRARAALHSPSTGVVDSYRLMARLEYLALQRGVMMAYRHEVTGVEPADGGYRVRYSNPDGSADTICCAWLINSAGLDAGRIAAWTGINLEEAGYAIYLCKGEYCTVSQSKAALVNRLIYPPPLEELQCLGVHITKTLDGRLRLGPDATYVQQIDYSVSPDLAVRFFQEAKAFLPFLEPGDLEPESAGIRPKLQGPGDPFRDFIVKHETERGLPGLINLLGIESPGLTCCLSLARMVASLPG